MIYNVEPFRETFRRTFTSGGNETTFHSFFISQSVLAVDLPSLSYSVCVPAVDQISHSLYVFRLSLAQFLSLPNSIFLSLTPSHSPSLHLTLSPTVRLSLCLNHIHVIFAYSTAQPYSFLIFFLPSLPPLPPHLG